jgi:integrase
MYDGLFRKHLLPILGDRPLPSIGVEDVQELKSTKLAEGLSPQTVKHLLRLLRQMLNHAVDWGYLRRNPATKVKDPSVPIKEMDCFSPEEVRLFLEHVPAKWKAFFLMAITTGLRQGEILAAKWSNLDWNSQQYFVRENLARKRGKYEGGLAPTKTEGATARVDVSPHCLDALRQHRARQAEEKLQAGEGYEDMDLIFANPLGTPLDHKNVVNRVFNPTLEAARLRRIRFHDLRHTCASLLIDMDENPKYIQRQMRHASIDTTFNRYGHLFPDKKREAMQRLDGLLMGCIG